MIVVIQRGEEVETISDSEIEAYDIRTGCLDLYKSPEERMRIFTDFNKVTFKKGNKAIAIFGEGKVFG